MIGRSKLVVKLYRCVIGPRGGKQKMYGRVGKGTKGVRVEGIGYRKEGKEKEWRGERERV